MSPPLPDTVSNPNAIQAQARLHHAYLLGLQLMVASREGPQVIGDWMFRLFRRQHESKFLSSFTKLGLTDLPHAVACARYHVLSNEIGGVAVQYMEENDRKAWVRFRYPRWMYDGPTICGMPVEVSRGFLRGWYAHNGVSLGNPRLGFVCVSEDMTGEFGLCGYFLEHDHDLAPEERLRFARDEAPPPWDPARQPRPPDAQWNSERLQKAARNYAMEYVRNGIVTLAEVIGEARTLALAGLAARLIGMQYWRETAALVGTPDGGADVAARYLARMFEGMGDVCEIRPGADSRSAMLEHRGLRILRDIDPASRDLLWGCWQELWIGALRAHEPMPGAVVSLDPAGAPPAALWQIGPGPIKAPQAQIR
ncbi:MAG: hypothetical protein IPM01_18210 [Burkholderiaceae bacterium]|nr:hypothetical protein [Burkholderiaceae bacterium]